MFRGIYYSSPLIYNLLTFIKLRHKYNTRYKIAAHYITGDQNILELCAGTGRLKYFLPTNCRYRAVDTSKKFCRKLEAKGIDVINQDILEYMKHTTQRADTTILLISLCHFYNQDLNQILESIKKTGKKIIIIEDVLKKKRSDKSLLQIIMNYLCALEYKIMTADEFRNITTSHGYKYEKYDEKYSIAIYKD